MTVGDPPRYSPAAPCRCGYDGEGVHRCHEPVCAAEGTPRPAVRLAGLVRPRGTETGVSLATTPLPVRVGEP